MNTTTVVPIIIYTEPDKCPNCMQIEHKITICGHCRYEYKNNEDIPAWQYILAVTFVIIVLVFILFIIMLIADWTSNFNNSTLIEILIYDWESLINGISHLRIW